MSLIALAQHVRGPRTLTRTLIVLIAVTAGIIGLLAMHSLNSHTTAPASSASTAVIAQTTADEHMQHSHAAPVDEAGCADCGEHDGMLAMACVLALLVTLLLMARRTHWQVGATRQVRADPPTLLGASPPARPPSLNVLCISRT